MAEEGEVLAGAGVVHVPQVEKHPLDFAGLLVVNLPPWRALFLLLSGAERDALRVIKRGRRGGANLRRRA